MVQIKVKKGSRTLSITNNANYQLVSVTGLNPPVADINVSEFATSDGGVFNLARVQKRNIVLQIQPFGNLETRRVELYGFMSPKTAITLDIETGSRHVTIDGYIESMEIDYNANPQLVQVSIICPDPFFTDVTQVDVTSPAVNNPSEIAQGALFKFNISSSISSLYIYSYTTHQMFQINMDMVEGDVIEIDTRQGQKSVKKNGFSVMQYVSLNNPVSKWIELEPGYNSFESSPAIFNTKFYPKYLGV